MTKALRIWWLSMGIWRWPNLLLVLAAVYLAVDYDIMSGRWINHGDRRLGNTELTLFTGGRIVPGKPFTARLDGYSENTVELTVNQIPVTLNAGEQVTQLVDMLAPESTAAPLAITVYDEQQNWVRWRLGRLY